MPKLLTTDNFLGLLAVAAFIAFAIWIANWDPLGSKQRLRDTATSATRQASVSEATTRATDHFIEHTTIIHEKANHAVQSVQNAPGAQTPIAEDRRAILCAALVSVRDSPVCTDSDGPQDPPSRLSGSNVSHANPG